MISQNTIAVKKGSSKKLYAAEFIKMKMIGNLKS